jgi:glycosyltransferase involved in cell wall biosynthesis
VHVIAIYDRLELRQELDEVGVPITVAYKHGKFDLTAAWRLRNLITAIGPDLIHAYLPAASFLTPLTKWIGVKAPVLQSERGINDWRSTLRLRCDNVVRRKVAHITCNALAIKKHLIEIEHLDAERISVIHNGLRPDRRCDPGNEGREIARRQIGAPPNGVIVTCVANFSAVKQHGTLLRAFHQAKADASALFLVLVGRGELESQIRQQIGDLDLRNSCRLITDCQNPSALLSASHIAILTSLLEGCSNALLEAMAMGLPVVASNTGGNPELVIHGEGGYLCPVGDVAAFSQALVRLANHPEDGVTMGRFNSRRISEGFTDDIMVSRTLTLYESILR